VAEGQGLPPPEIPLSTLPDHHLGDGLLGGLLDEVMIQDMHHATCQPLLPQCSGCVRSVLLKVVLQAANLCRTDQSVPHAGPAAYSAHQR
jgi:hypothetical protein